MNIFLSLLVILLISNLFSLAARKIHASDVIGLIVAGIFLSLPFFDFLIVGREALISNLSIAGLFALMFLAGFEVSWNVIMKEERHSLVITISTVLISLIVGTTLMLVLGYSLESALVIGICFSITAEAAKARVLLQLKKITSKLGSLMMGTGIVNDVIGIILFLGVLFVFADNIVWREVAVLFGSVVSFALGSLVHYRFDRFSSRLEKMEKYFLMIVVPFFFLEMGLSLTGGFYNIDWLVLTSIMTFGAFSQLLGVLVTKPITHLRPKQLFLLGWGMNAKGSVELAIAHIALVTGLIKLSLYSSLVLMVLVSTILFQIVIFTMVKKNPEVMD